MESFFKDKQRLTAYAMMLVIFIVVALFAPSEKVGYSAYSHLLDSSKGTIPKDMMVHYGAWTLLIPVVMFSFVLLTKSFLEAFIWSAFLSVFMRFRLDTIPAFTEEQIKVLLDYDNARMILLYFCIGSVLVAVSKGGGAKAFADWAKRKAKNSKVSLVIMWIMNVVLSIDDELSAFTTGTAITPLTDSYRIPREKSAFMIRATAVAPATLWPLGAWTVFIATLLESSGFASSGQGVTEYMKIVPFLFFPIILLIIALLVALGIISDFGKMRRAVERVKNGGPIAPIDSGKKWVMMQKLILKT